MAAKHRQDDQRGRRRGQPFFDAMVPWVPMVVGVVIMAGYLIYATVLSIGHRSLPESPTNLGAYEVPATPIPAPTTTAPNIDPVPVVVPARANPPVQSPVTATPAPSPPTSRSPAPADPPPAAPPAPASDLAGTYFIEAAHPDVFIGAVSITSQSSRAHDWTVELVFPASVGRLNTFWVDGTPQPVLERTADGYRFTSTVPVEAGSSVVLKFHFDHSGGDLSPTRCAVNGAACTLR